MKTPPPLPIKAQPWKTRAMRSPVKGNQWVYELGNGYGASVFQETDGRPGLYDLAVVAFQGDDWHVDCSTPVTDDVLSCLSLDQVAATLAAIARLPRKASTDSLTVDPAVIGTPFPGCEARYVTGECGHPVARSEWAAGYRKCERC
jgi:hypothetical protein